MGKEKEKKLGTAAAAADTQPTGIVTDKLRPIFGHDDTVESSSSSSSKNNEGTDNDGGKLLRSSLGALGATNLRPIFEHDDNDDISSNTNNDGTGNNDGEQTSEVEEEDEILDDPATAMLLYNTGRTPTPSRHSWM